MLDGLTLNDKTCQFKSRYFLHIIPFPLSCQLLGGHEPIFLNPHCIVVRLEGVYVVYTVYIILQIFSKRGKHWSEQVSVATNLKQVIILPNTKWAVVKTLIFWTCWGQFLILGSPGIVIVLCMFLYIWICKYLRPLIFFQHISIEIFLNLKCFSVRHWFRLRPGL